MVFAVSLLHVQRYSGSQQRKEKGAFLTVLGTCQKTFVTGCMYKSKNTAIFREINLWEMKALRSILQFFVKSLIKHVYRIKELQLQFFRENNNMPSDQFFFFNFSVKSMTCSQIIFFFFFIFFLEIDI